MTLILCAVFGYAGFQLGMWIAHACDEVRNWLDAYLDGCGAYYVWDLWR